ncbi:hypothetical protein [Photobacterium leiognathi]|uniref:hypothetical protein n=1 Tax=Photobacterium leiognathi TaxID=553611 RepID=UPI0029826BA5|nr:hypothetical protein [Photobacterium leiognathi]
MKVNKRCVDNAFKQLVSSSFSEASDGLLKLVCIGVWYQDYVPDITEFTQEQAKRSCYILDRLMRFNVVTTHRQRVLIELITMITENYNIKQDNNAKSLVGVDKHAVKWGLNEDLRVLFRSMLKYQTRHFQRYYKTFM